MSEYATYEQAYANDDFYERRAARLAARAQQREEEAQKKAKVRSAITIACSLCIALGMSYLFWYYYVNGSFLIYWWMDGPHALCGSTVTYIFNALVAGSVAYLIYCIRHRDRPIECAFAAAYAPFGAFSLGLLFLFGAAAVVPIVVTVLFAYKALNDKRGVPYDAKNMVLQVIVCFLVCTGLFVHYYGFFARTPLATSKVGLNGSEPTLEANLDDLLVPFVSAPGIKELTWQDYADWTRRASLINAGAILGMDEEDVPEVKVVLLPGPECGGYNDETNEIYVSAQYLIYEDVPLNLVSVASHETYHALQNLMIERGADAFDVAEQDITQKRVDAWDANLDALETSAYLYDYYLRVGWARRLEELGYVVDWGDTCEPHGDDDPHYERYL